MAFSLLMGGGEPIENLELRLSPEYIQVLFNEERGLPNSMHNVTINSTLKSIGDGFSVDYTDNSIIIDSNDIHAVLVNVILGGATHGSRGWLCGKVNGISTYRSYGYDLQYQSSYIVLSYSEVIPVTKGDRLNWYVDEMSAIGIDGLYSHATVTKIY